MLDKNGFIPVSVKEEVRAKLYNQFYSNNIELFQRNPILYWTKAQKFMDENYRNDLVGKEVPFVKSYPAQKKPVPTSELTDTLQANLTPQQLNAKAMVMLANQLVLLKAAGSGDLYTNLGLILDGSMNLELTEWDQKEFSGTQVADALRIYGLNATDSLLSICPDLKLVLEQIAQPDKLPKNTAGLLEKLAHLNYSMQAIPNIVAYQLRPNGLYSYGSAALLATRAAIPVEPFNSALIAATQRPLAFPHFVMGDSESIVIDIEKTWYGARKVVKKVLDGIGRLAKPLPAENVTHVEDSQVKHEASWLEFVVASAKELPSRVKELGDEVEAMSREQATQKP